MSNEAQGFVEVKLDKPRHFRYDFNALVELEEHTGVDLLAGAGWQPTKFADIRWFVWLGLKHEDAELTEEQVGAMLGMDNLTEVTDAMNRAFDLAMPEKSEDDPGDPLATS